MLHCLSIQTNTQKTTLISVSETTGLSIALLRVLVAGLYTCVGTSTTLSELIYW